MKNTRLAARRETAAQVKGLALLFIILFAGSAAYGQQGLIMNVTATSEAVQGNPVIVTASVKSLSQISDALLFFRNSLSTDFQQTEMTLDQTSETLNGTVPADYVIEPYIEVYVRITLRDGTAETYPVQSPTETPVRIAVASAESQRDILIISPDPNKPISLSNLLISASMLYAPENVDRQKTQLYFDGINVTSNSVVSGDIIVYSPAKFPTPVERGRHTAKVVLYKDDGTEYKSLEWSFYVIAPGEEQQASAFTYQGRAQIQERNEVLNNVSNWYEGGTLSLGGSAYGVNLGANMLLTSEERSYRQPQDRYGFTASTSWLDLQLGDSYPSFSPLIMNGMRVRGISGEISAGFFHIQTAYGQTVRGINGSLDTIIVSPDSLLQATTGNYVRLNDSTYVNTNYGTFARSLFAIRPSFDFGSHGDFGITFLKSSDAMSSISVGNSPTQNVAVGSDLNLNFDQRRINFDAEGAMSMVNDNIAPGNLTAAQIDTITHSNAGDQINNVVPITTLSKIITINEFLVPLDPAKLSSLAWDVGLSANYFNTFAKIGYVYRGPDYTSFGQPFIRTDIRGFNFNLRPRLMSNQLLLSLSYEDLFDNLQHNKFATTQYANTNASVSYFPLGNVPNVTVGVSAYANSNDLPLDSIYAQNNLTMRYYLESSYNFNYVTRNFLSVSFGITNRSDKVLMGTNLNDYNVSLLLNSDFGKIPLRTTIGLNINGNKSIQKTLDSLALLTQQIQTFNYTFVTIGASYSLLASRLTFGLNYTPTFGAFVRNAYGLTGSYQVAKSQSINLNVNYYGMTGGNDFIGSLIYAIDF